MAQYLYIIHEKGTHYYKIGISDDPDKRLADLQTGNPRELERISVMKFDQNVKDVEGNLQQELKRYRKGIKGGTEWFKFPERYTRHDVETEIDELCKKHKLSCEKL